MNSDYTCYTGIEPWELKTIEEKIHRLEANNQEAYAHHEAFGTLHLKSLEVIPAQEMLTEYKQWLIQ